MIHGALGLACGIVIGAVGAAIVADWYVSRELARMTDRFLAVDAQPTTVTFTSGGQVSDEMAAKINAALARQARRGGGPDFW